LSNKKIRKILIGDISDWIKQFDLKDYVDNPPMIEKLHEEKQSALLYYFEMEKKVKNLENQIHEYELENQRLKIVYSELSQKSTLTYIIGIIATIFVGFGINVITSKPYTWIGWVLVVTAIVLEILALILKPKKEKV